MTVLDDFNDFYDPRIKRATSRRSSSATTTADRGRHPRRELVDRPFDEGGFDASCTWRRGPGSGPASSSRSSTKRSTASAPCTCSRRPRHRPRGLHLRLVVVGLRHQREGPVRRGRSESTSRSAPTPPPSGRGELLCFNYHHLYGSRPPACASSPSTARPSGPRWRSTSSPTCWREETPCRCSATATADATTPMSTTSSTASSQRSTWRPASRSSISAAPRRPAWRPGAWIAEELAVEPRIEYLPDQPGDVPITYADVTKAEQAARLLAQGTHPRGLEEIRRLVRGTDGWLGEPSRTLPQRSAG